MVEIEESKKQWLKILSEQIDRITSIRSDLESDVFEDAILTTEHLRKSMVRVDETIDNIREYLTNNLDENIISLLGEEYSVQFSPNAIRVIFDGDLMGTVNIERRKYTFCDFAIHEDAFEIGEEAVNNHIESLEEEYSNIGVSSALRNAFAGKKPTQVWKKIRTIQGEITQQREDNLRSVDMIERTVVEERRKTVARVNTLLKQKYRVIQFFTEFGFEIEQGHERKIYVRELDIKV